MTAINPEVLAFCRRVELDGQPLTSEAADALALSLHERERFLRQRVTDLENGVLRIRRLAMSSLNVPVATVAAEILDGEGRQVDVVDTLATGLHRLKLLVRPLRGATAVLWAQDTAEAAYYATLLENALVEADGEVRVAVLLHKAAANTDYPPDHPLHGVPRTLLEAARSVLSDPPLEPVADAIVERLLPWLKWDRYITP